MSTAPHTDTGPLLAAIEGLARQHYSDKEIAAGLEIPYHKVANLRKRYDIPAGQPRGKVYRRPVRRQWRTSADD